MTSTDRQLAQKIDHTMLSPTATPDDIARACRETRDHGFAAVVVPPSYVPEAVRQLGGHSARVCSVVSFPFGFDDAETKASAARRLVDAGVDEIDVVMSIGRFLGGDADAVRREVDAVSAACAGRALFKLIIETAYLSDEDIVRAAEIGVKGGVDFIKTSTGHAPRGATVRDIERIRSVCEGAVAIKAAGGIRTREQALALLAAGAHRIGSSTSVDLVRT